MLYRTPTMDLPSVLRGVSAVSLIYMNTLRLALSCLALFCGVGLRQAAADTTITATPATTAPKSGYNVVVEINFSETGAVEGTKVVESDDMSGDHLLDSVALNLAANIKQPPRLKDGKPVKYTARAPFNFPVEDDEGLEANNAPKPALNSQENGQQRPIFPENLVAKGESGGAILELIVGSFGNVESVKVLRSSHQEYADSAAAALKTWIFVPAQKDGVNVESRWRIAIGFSVDGKNIDWKWRVAPRPSLGSYVVVHPRQPDAGAPATPPSADPGAATPGFNLPAAPTK